jgi:predicted Ser/Thr protein kinase
VWVTIKNTTEESETIEFYIDDDLEITATIEPKASIEKEYELSQGSHSFELYHEVNGTYVLSQSQSNDVEADSSYFFELA